MLKDKRYQIKIKILLVLQEGEVKKRIKNAFKHEPYVKKYGKEKPGQV